MWIILVNERVLFCACFSANTQYTHNRQGGQNKTRALLLSFSFIGSSEKITTSLEADRRGSPSFFLSMLFYYCTNPVVV